ncbi:MAG TPA: PilZ domain-containing protein [Lachnospiraceae bacterium]|nr:PilZ domain-containing protein [Lachnospiraceae bacterium]
MVLNHCTACDVYGIDGEARKRIPVNCTGEQITLLPGGEYGLSDSAKVRIDFFDSRMGYLQTNCQLAVRKNDDPAIKSAWVADCNILEVLQIREMRRFVRVGLGKEVVMTLSGKGDFEALIQNISEGGIFFVSTTQVQWGDVVSFSYCFIEQEYRLEARILREEELLNGRYGYGCEFYELPKGAGRDIRQFVYLREQGRIL